MIYKFFQSIVTLLVMSDLSAFVLRANVEQSGPATSLLMGTGKAVLWDVDGTLSDSFMLGFTSTSKVLENNGKSAISEEEYHQGTKFTTPRRLAWHVTGNPDDPIGHDLGAQFDDLYVALVSMETAPFYDGILSVLDELQRERQDLQLGALSNACGAYVEAVLRVNGVKNRFGVQLGADQVEAAKPRPEGLLQCCRELGVQPGSCVYVGDSPTDAQAAAAAGMPSVGVTWGSHPAQSVRAAFTVTVDTVPELQEALLKLL